MAASGASRLVLVLVLACVPLGVSAHTYHLGECPDVDPAPSFQMSKMLGIWYVIQKTSTASSCITYNFTAGDEPGSYELEQVSQHFFLGLTPLEHVYSYRGILTRKDSAVPARMTVKFPLSVAGSASYTVFMTDYDNYAGVFTCQRLTFAHRQSATILSRRKELDKAHVDRVRDRLSSHNVSPFDLSVVSQSGCPKSGGGGLEVDIDPDTLPGIVRKAGETIGDGIHYAAEAGKKIYHKIRDDDEKGATERSGSRSMDSKLLPDDDAEWLP